MGVPNLLKGLLNSSKHSSKDYLIKLKLRDNTQEIHRWRKLKPIQSRMGSQLSVVTREGEQEVLDKIAKYKVTIRCMPLEQDQEEGTCIFTGKPSTRRAIFGRSY